MVPGATPYPEGSLPYLKDSVAKFYSDAQFNHKYNVHERQWTLLVAQILGEVRRWRCGQKFRLLNV